MTERIMIERVRMIVHHDVDVLGCCSNNVIAEELRK